MRNRTRREFIRDLGGLGVAGLAVASNCRTSVGLQEPFRNIICIIGDDHAAGVLGCYGNPAIHTPNLDRMAAKGVRFTHAYANAPLCSASRQSLLTGKYPHACGVTLLTTSFPESQLTIAEHLKAAGFATGVVGKTHFNNSLPHGFDVMIDTKEYREHRKINPPRPIPAGLKTRPEWKPFRDPARIWLNAEGLPSASYDEDDLGTFLANQAATFIRDHKEQRFCLWIGFHEPHSPFHFPIEYTGRYKPDDMPLPQGSPEDDRWIPEIFRDLTDDEKRGIIASYYTSVEYLDKNVGLILAELEQQGLDENTLVIYLGDQGYLLGDHKRFEKHMMWEEAIRSPLILQAGSQFGVNRAVDALTEFVDLTPTILDLTGVPAMPGMQGKSLFPLLLGQTGEHKDFVFSEFLADNKAMIRSKEWKYIFTSGKLDLGQGYATGYGPSGLLHRLYNMQADPLETTNVAGLPENKAVLDSLRQKMLELFKKTHPDAKSLPVGMSTDEQLVWFCEPPDENANINAK